MPEVAAIVGKNPEFNILALFLATSALLLAILIPKLFSSVISRASFLVKISVK